jgi:hypothetical protein
MPLSRHFYSLDEVQAALLYTTAQNTPSEALFWCQELILSGCASEAISILFQSWLWHTGPMRLQWLINAWKLLGSDELSEDDILLSTFRLSSIKASHRDNSLWSILVLTLNSEMPDRITRKMPPFIPSDDKKEIYFVSSMFQGKARSAWWISRYIPTDRVWVLLEWYIQNIKSHFQQEYLTCLEALLGYDKLLGYKSDGYDVIVRCMAIIMLCNNKEQEKYSFKEENGYDIDNTEFLNELSKSVGRRERRVYSIPTLCLYGITQRGKMRWSQNNLTQLYDIEKHLVGSPYWDEVLSEYADISDPKNIVWHSYDKAEEFYDKYFPDEICDEWNKKDQLKSHGDGILGPHDKPNIAKYSRNYLSKIARFSYNKIKEVNSYLETLDISDCILERIVDYYKQHKQLTEEDLKRLRPVRKIKII